MPNPHISTYCSGNCSTCHRMLAQGEPAHVQHDQRVNQYQILEIIPVIFCAACCPECGGWPKDGRGEQ